MVTVQLETVRDRGTVVIAIRQAVDIPICADSGATVRLTIAPTGAGQEIADLAYAVPILVDLIWIDHPRAIVTAVWDSVAIEVSGISGFGVARVSESISVGVGLVGIRRRGAVVVEVSHAVSVTVRVVGWTGAGFGHPVFAPLSIAGRHAAVAATTPVFAGARVADPIAVGVCLVGVERVRAVILDIENPIVVRVLVHDRLPAGVADPIAVLVRLIGVRNVNTIVFPIGYTVTIEVTVAEIAYVTDPIGILVRLIGVRRLGAVVLRVGDSVAVDVTDACVTDPIPVLVRLIGVGRERTVVRGIKNSVPVRVCRKRVGGSDDPNIGGEFERDRRSQS
jgi:hypothetical protein